MKPSDFQKTVQCRFESCLKKVVRHVVKDYQKKLKRRQKEETLVNVNEKVSQALMNI